MSPGNIIVLNGTSSSGKTTIAKILQRRLDEPYLHLGNDQFLNPNAPDRMIVFRGEDTGPMQAEGWLAVFHGDRLVDLRVGPVGLRWLRGMVLAMAAWSQAGNHLVADLVMHDEAIVRAAADAFHTLPAWLVNVYCPLEVAEQREQERAERRAVGGARMFYEGVYGRADYDLQVDTSLCSAEECAGRIRDYVQAGHTPLAFRRLHQRFSRLP